VLAAAWGGVAAVVAPLRSVPRSGVVLLSPVVFLKPPLRPVVAVWPSLCWATRWLSTWMSPPRVRGWAGRSAHPCWQQCIRPLLLRFAVPCRPCCLTGMDPISRRHVWDIIGEGGGAEGRGSCMPW
jgi:hypothetical protein